MQMTRASAPARRVIEVDEVLLRRVLWTLAGVAVGVLALSVDRPVLASVAGGAVVGLAAVWYAGNELRRDFKVPIDKAWIATIRSLAVNGLSYDVRRTRRGTTEGSAAAGDARVRVECHPGGVTRVRVRVGWFKRADNQRRAALVLEE